MKSNFYDIFPRKKILIGMLHLAGNSNRKIGRALKEIINYKKQGLDGAIVEDYHGGINDVENTLEVLTNINHGLIIGVNVLRNPYLSFELARKYRAKFVQFDTIQASPGDSKSRRFNEELYLSLRKKYPEIIVLGGVRFKYVPLTGKSLEEDIKDGISKCDAIVTTGEGTGIETPTQKLKNFKEKIGNFPLIVGAGVNDKVIREQMEIADGAIIGSYFKDYDTEAEVISERVKTLFNLVKS